MYIYTFMLYTCESILNMCIYMNVIYILVYIYIWTYMNVYDIHQIERKFKPKCKDAII